MEFSYISDWLNLLFRWLHIIFGAAWIGTSFYFNWLNNHLRPPAQQEQGVGGELWSVHGGYFYLVRKYEVAPDELPEMLHWFKWEAYLTWLTGICLLAVVYYLSADVFMVNPESDFSGGQAVLIGIATLVAGWHVYHFACKWGLTRAPVAFAVIMFALVTGLAFGLTHVMSSRAAYIHIGALLGTCMALNVFFVIIPNQRQMVDAMLAGNEPDGAQGKAGALRSLHNNYMTLPVLFIMVSNHFPMTFGHRFNWAVLAALAIIGAGTRHWFNLRGRGTKNVWILPAAAVSMIALAFAMSPFAQSLMYERKTREQAVEFAEANQIIAARCTPCHSTTPTYTGFQAPPKGVILETPEQIKALAAKIDQIAIKTPVMPLGNLTKMTQEERDLLGQWIAEGAKLQ